MENKPAKNSIKGTQSTVLLSKERGRTENSLVKNTLNGTQGTVLFPKEKESLNNPVKNSITGNDGTMLQWFFLMKGEELKYLSEK